MEKLKVIELFSGIGAPKMALKSLGIDHEVIGISEILPTSINIYNILHGETKTEPRNFYKKANWLERNFPYLDIRKCFFNCPDKKLMNIDIMIDDHLDNLGGAQRYKIIFDYPYNRNIHKKDCSCFRCYNWEEIYNIIKKLNEVEVSLNGNNY